jgi:hypothetical protein
VIPTVADLGEDSRDPPACAVARERTRRRAGV